jgi:hypothetical protein
VAAALSWAVSHAKGCVTQAISIALTTPIYEFATHRSQRLYVSPVDYAVVYLGLRDNDQVFQELNRAAEQQLSSLSFLKTSVEYDPLRTDPRFADLLRRVHLD